MRAVAQSLAPGEFQTLLAFVITGRSSLSGPCLLLPFPQECSLSKLLGPWPDPEQAAWNFSRRRPRRKGAGPVGDH